LTTPVVIQKTSRSTLDYLKIVDEAEKPISQRQKIIHTNRGTIRPPRKYHLDAKKLQVMKDEMAKGSIPNPFRKGGVYHAFVQALINLGVNKKHSFLDIRKEMKTVLMSFTTKDNVDGWTAFRDKASRNSLCAKDVNGRIIQNAFVLQRLSGFDPYGEKLRQLGCCIDIFKDAQSTYLFQLRTGILKYEDVSPINEYRKA
jgi:hypothetical protein